MLYFFFFFFERIRYVVDKTAIDLDREFGEHCRNGQTTAAQASGEEFQALIPRARRRIVLKFPTSREALRRAFVRQGTRSQMPSAFVLAATS